ncbi:DUF3592 domain-containing protein [Corynebacterium sp. NPDC060344]|uniref:DUF3592 domain-containing protein n=1 Tax=Corynebacterium sp. NPDC060344 TaxID=3347101 RepID=UPI00365FB990
MSATPNDTARRTPGAHPGWPRRLRQLILFLLICLFVVCAGLVFGAWSDDRAIESDTGRAVASVRHVGALRTAVDFTDETGEFRSPPTGLLYPVGLEEGQRVRVEYDRAEPERVRVEGRGWTLSLIPALSILVVGLLVAAPLWWLSIRATRRSLEDPATVTPVTPRGEVGM